jgi:hypothetical protein
MKPEAITVERVQRALRGDAESDRLLWCPFPPTRSIPEPSACPWRAVGDETRLQFPAGFLPVTPFRSCGLRGGGRQRGGSGHNRGWGWPLRRCRCIGFLRLSIAFACKCLQDDASYVGRFIRGTRDTLP